MPDLGFHSARRGASAAQPRESQRGGQSPATRDQLAPWVSTWPPAWPGPGGISVLACDGRCGGTRVRRPAIARASHAPRTGTPRCLHARPSPLRPAKRGLGVAPLATEPEDPLPCWVIRHVPSAAGEPAPVGPCRFVGTSGYTSPFAAVYHHGGGARMAMPRPEAEGADGPLVLASLDGDVAAFARLFQRHAGRVRMSVRRRFPDTDAEEVAQEAFVRAWCHLPQLQSPEAFGPWVRAIARAVAVDACRRERRRNALGHVAPYPGGRPARGRGGGRRKGRGGRFAGAPTNGRLALLLRRSPSRCDRPASRGFPHHGPRPPTSGAQSPAQATRLRTPAARRPHAAPPHRSAPQWASRLGTHDAALPPPRRARPARLRPRALQAQGTASRGSSRLFPGAPAAAHRVAPSAVPRPLLHANGEM